ncbi:MAG: hypothetical protein EOM72_08625 [Opitutae bacterium]|nr:hypothetical protein [Opitutae bacterium]
MRLYNSVHRQQLFHWIGDHIEKRANRGHLNDDLREEYVECLRSSLRNGLWSKTPRDGDCIGDGACISVHRPITCFTEWPLGKSLPHTLRYGRLGLGFPKRFVLSHGGQPVTYLRDGVRNAPYAAAIIALAKWFEQPPGGLLDGKEFQRIRERFFYMAHFNKRIKKPKAQKHLSSKHDAVTKPHSAFSHDAYKRIFGPILHYLEEREWRIVYDKSIARFFHSAEGGEGRPEHYLLYKPGKDLFTVVLPDNKTINLAMKCEDIKGAMYRENAPHITVLSLEDIGTF